MKPYLHPKFKLNGQSFPTVEALRDHAIIIGKEGEEDQRAVGKFILEWLDPSDSITVKTSGSTGVPKPIQLKKDRAFNSASATVSFFHLNEGTTALLCLSAEYIAGKMMLVRAMVAGWDLHVAPPGKNPLRNIQRKFDFAAMVPYQVYHSLPELHKISKLIVGGGAVPWKLEKQLQQVTTKVFATYGMTETISHIAIRPINGKEKSVLFSALPNVSFSQDEKGCLQIHAPLISEKEVITNDVVELLSPTSFRFLGRRDNVINTGGIKVYPESIESTLSGAINEVFFIASEKDEALGERIVMIVESESPLDSAEFSKIFQKLSPYERPKRIYFHFPFSYTETGKIRRKEVLRNLRVFGKSQ